MASQKVFKRDYQEYLISNIDPVKYNQSRFDYDITKVESLYKVSRPDYLEERLDSTRKGDYVSAVAIYEAYRDIPPLLAQMNDLWVYLSHVDLFNYTRNRWPFLVNDKNAVTFIKNHWFVNAKHMNGCIAGLWWNIRLTVDENRDDPYELSKVLFRSNRLREYSILRSVGASRGILGFIAENKELFKEAFESKVLLIMSIFNIVSASKNLSYLPEDFFKKTLENFVYKIESIT